MKAASAFVATALLMYFIAFWAVEQLRPFKYLGDPTDVDLQGVYESVHFAKVTGFSMFAAIFAGCVAAYAATVPWNRWHFSLRTLLIVMTLIAMLLGLVKWFGR
jgi:hypothetical protein